MEIQKAIEILKQEQSAYKNGLRPLMNISEAFNIAIIALEQHIGAECKCGAEPRVLTMDELKSWDGAVWLVCHHWQGWALPYYSPLDKRINFMCRNGYDGAISRAIEDYNCDSKWNFVCYDRQPKGSDI